MTSRRFRAIGLAGAALLTWGLRAFATAPPELGGDALAAQLLRSGRNAEALVRIDAVLGSRPGDPVLLGFKVKALMGMSRWEEGLAVAAPAAVLHPDWPVLRLFAGDCAYQIGRPGEAMALWAPLLKREDLYWADDASVRTVRALVASGRRDEARAQLDEALAKLQEPSMALLVQKLSLAPSGTEGLAALHALERAYPSASAPYVGLRGLYAALGLGRLLDETEPGDVRTGAELREIRQRSLICAQSAGITGAAKEKYALPSFSLLEKDTGPKRRPYLALRVNLDGSAPRLMILDSGSPAVLLTDQTAHALGLVPAATTTCAAVSGGARKSPIVLLKVVEAAGLRLGNVPALLLPQPDSMRKDFAGIVPLRLFERHAVLLEPKAARMALLPAGTRPEDALGEGCFGVPALWAEGKPMVRASVEGGGEGFFLLDTGAGRSALSRRLAQRLREGGAKASREDAVESVAGLRFVDSIAGVHLVLGPERIELPGCAVMDLEEEDTVPCLGIIGLDVVSRFRVFFDYSHDTVAFKPYSR